ncbi:FXSXX-COOH protein [Krasilnikovia cinnamomea]|uniref:FXSXX-COOH protein n=1 Tax=Krasilnikovia cinnamomea TaxID=349313 RepID=A0A4Q7ZPB9_9ACTN|nr:FxSxx-COOH cyclophane-containing RiPP peptide [Krasilnikovia cinnamomea]RZU52255.1 FXSXX-COOH protein [Krasilnikovia cinnamomea]
MYVDLGSTGQHADVEWHSIMIDVSGLSLADLAEAVPPDRADSPLAQCLHRLTADLDRPGDPIAGFNSAL